jgi:hypothetical protein
MRMSMVIAHIVMTIREMAAKSIRTHIAQQGTVMLTMTTEIAPVK